MHLVLPGSLPESLDQVRLRPSSLFPWLLHHDSYHIPNSWSYISPELDSASHFCIQGLIPWPGTQEVFGPPLPDDYMITTM